MNWIFYIIGTLICFTALNILQKIIVIDSKNPRAFGFVFNIIAASITIIFFLLAGGYQRFSLPSGYIPYVFMATGVVCYGLFERYRFKTVQLLDASVLATILNLSFIISFVGSLFVYGEHLTVPKTGGVICILISLFLVTYQRQQKKVNHKGIVMGMLISVLLGIAWMTDKKGAEYFNADTYSIFVWLFPLIFIYFPSIKKEDIQDAISHGSWKIVVLSFLNALGYLLQLKAFETAEATVVMPLIQLATLFTVILGIVLLKERDQMKRKIAAAVLACIGVYFLV